MQRARWSRPSCLVMIAGLAVLSVILAWLMFGDVVRTPSPSSVTKETSTYDTDVPSENPAGD